MDSNKSITSRSALLPQRRSGKERVAAILEAGAEVIAEKGYDEATMAEIALRAKSPIGSLYRFFPNKEILAHALMEHYGSLVSEAFDMLDRHANPHHIEQTADMLVNFLLAFHNESRAMPALLEARSEWSAKRLEFRKAILMRISNTLMLLAPHIPNQTAENMAVVVLHNMKMMKTLTFQDQFPNAAGATDELCLMNRLYLVSKLS